MNLSQDAQFPNRLYVDGQPPVMPPPPQAGPPRRPTSLATHGDPFPQVLNSQPDLLVITYPQVRDDSKPPIAETVSSTADALSAPPLGRWRSS